VLGPELFSAVARSAMLLRQSADLTDNFNNMLLSGFKCSLNNRRMKQRVLLIA